MLRKLKIYLDTSVINFLFADDAPEKKEVTVDFFENYLDNYDVFISEYVIREIMKTKNPEKLELLLGAISNYRINVYEETNQEIVDLAKIYIDKKIIPYNKVDDALHVAFCVFFEFDILLSWNFKHLANINKQNSINAINLELGYLKTLLLINPMQVTYGT